MFNREPSPGWAVIKDRPPLSSPLLTQSRTGITQSPASARSDLSALSQSGTPQPPGTTWHDLSALSQPGANQQPGNHPARPEHLVPAWDEPQPGNYPARPEHPFPPGAPQPLAIAQLAFRTQSQSGTSQSPITTWHDLSTLSQPGTSQQPLNHPARPGHPFQTGAPRPLAIAQLTFRTQSQPGAPQPPGTTWRDLSRLSQTGTAR